MNFVKRGIISVKRRVGKSVILLILVFVLGNIIAGAISIEQAVKNTEVNMRKKMGAVATAELDYEKIYKEDPNFDYQTLEYLSSNAVHEIGKLPYVKYYDYSMSYGMQSEEIKRYVNEENSNTWVRSDTSYEYFNFTGVEYKEVLDFQEQKAKLVEGRTFTDDEIKTGKSVLIISDKFAELNDLSIGSTIKFKTDIYKPVENEIVPISKEIAIADVAYSEPEVIDTYEVEMEVIGIFQTQQEAKKDNNNEWEFNYLDEEKQNKMYVPNQAIRKINDFYTTVVRNYNPSLAEEGNQEYFTPLFVLNDPLDLEAFKKEAQEMLPQYYRMIDSGESFSQVAAPMKNMEWIASIVLYVAIGATIVILSLLITLFLRDRKHEVGIYLSLGEKKQKIMAQIVLEVVLIAAIGITISLFSGNLIANQMSKNMLRNQILAEEESQYRGRSNVSILWQWHIRLASDMEAMYQQMSY